MTMIMMNMDLLDIITITMMIDNQWLIIIVIDHHQISNNNKKRKYQIQNQLCCRSTGFFVESARCSMSPIFLMMMIDHEIDIQPIIIINDDKNGSIMLDLSNIEPKAFGARQILLNFGTSHHSIQSITTINNQQTEKQQVSR